MSHNGGGTVKASTTIAQIEQEHATSSPFAQLSRVHHRHISLSANTTRMAMTNMTPMLHNGGGTGKTLVREKIEHELERQRVEQQLIEQRREHQQKNDDANGIDVRIQVLSGTDRSGHHAGGAGGAGGGSSHHSHKSFLPSVFTAQSFDSKERRVCGGERAASGNAIRPSSLSFVLSLHSS